MFGYCRLPAGESLLAVFQAAPEGSLSKIIRSLGRLRVDKAQESLMPFLRQEDNAVCTEAFLALLRIGNIQAMKQCC